jgi:hypothetical protein
MCSKFELILIDEAMKKLIGLMLMIFSVWTGCNVEKNKNPAFISGLWYSENDERFIFFSDSLILFYPFYPYTKWEIRNDTLKVLDLNGLNTGVSNWFEYPCMKLDDKEAHFVFTEEISRKLKFRKITELEKADYHLEKLSLLISDCGYDKDCVSMKIEVSMSDSTATILKVKNSEPSISCTLNSQELMSIKYLASMVPWEGINTPLFSNVIHSKYFSMSVEFKDPNQNKTILSDTGGFAPSSIDNLITFVWATSQLRCVPNDYHRDLFIN